MLLVKWCVAWSGYFIRSLILSQVGYVDVNLRFRFNEDWVEGIFWISDTTPLYSIVYQRAKAALIDDYPGKPFGHGVRTIAENALDRENGFVYCVIPLRRLFDV